MDKHALLAEFAKCESEIAFATIVSEHVNLVYSAALRATGNPHHAEEITQAVFVLLARKAGTFPSNVVVSGWLYQTARLTAANFMKREYRRQHREQEAYMQSTLNESGAAAWEQIAPLLDDAMGHLGETDRTAVVLRFFENKTAAEVAATLNTTEAAAHKRVSRAVERLREFFAKRGLTAGASGFAAVISANAVQAAPAGLAFTISTTAALTGATLATTATITATKAIAMTTLQKTVVTATIAVLAGVGIYEARQASQLRDQVQTLQQQETALTARIQELESAATTPPEQLASVPETRPQPGSSTDLLRLRGEVARLRHENEESKLPVTHETVTARYKNAQELARNGDTAAALREYLWCYDVGMPRSPSFSGVRSSFLLSAIAKLGESYPEALTALRERRDQALQRILTSENDPQAGNDYAALSRTLKEEQDLLATFDQLPPDDNRRKALAEVAYDQLLAAQRYSDALSGRSYEKISMFFDMGKMDIPLPANAPNPEKILQNRRDSLIKTTVKDVEMLAGAGDLTHARTLAKRLLAYDNTPETTALLSQHLARAGQANLLVSSANR